MSRHAGRRTESGSGQTGKRHPVGWMPAERTSSARLGMSEKCYSRTHALQQIGRWSASERGLPLARPRQHDLEVSEKSRLRLDVDAAAVLFYDDVVAH
jgi:hypothetical protein